MNEESRWNVDNCNALRGLPWDVTEPGAEATEVSLTTSNHPSAFDATSALRHKDRIEEIHCGGNNHRNAWCRFNRFSN